MRLNVAFIPPSKILNQAVELGEQLASAGEPYFILDQKNYFAHITIYSPEYPDDQENNVLEVIEDLSKTFQPVQFNFSKLESHQGYIGIEYQKTAEIQDIHEKLVKALNPLRQGLIREKYKSGDYKMNFSEEQLRNIETYGYPDAMSLYNPHLTIIRLKDEKVAKEAAANISQSFSNFIVGKIGVYRMGEHGTARSLLKEFSLGI